MRPVEQMIIVVLFSFILKLTCVNAYSYDCEIQGYKMKHLGMSFYEQDKYIACNHGVAECYHHYVDPDHHSHYITADVVPCPNVSNITTLVQSHTTRSRRLAVTTNSRRLWDNGVMCFNVGNGQFSQGQYQTLYNAMRHIELVTNVRFLPLNRCQQLLNQGSRFCDSCRTYIRIDHAGGRSSNCNSTVGSTSGVSRMYLGNRCFTGDNERREDYGTVIHEIGHSLGLYHEHQNPSAHLMYFWSEIRSSEWNNYRPRSDLFATDWDRFSIMHYPATNGFCVPRFCYGGERPGTCVRRGTRFCTVNRNTDCQRPNRSFCDSIATNNLGQRRFLSFYDQHTLNRMYTKPAWIQEESQLK